MSLILNETVIEIRTSDNFINATQLCKAGCKKFNDWIRLVSTKELIKELEKSLKKSDEYKGYVVDVKKGNSSKYKSGSWVHPCLATAIAQWISPSFSLKVSQWIEEWKEFKPENKELYFEELTHLKPSKKTQLEREIQYKLKEELGAEMEVETPAGFIDLETESEIIEIKEVGNWKHAIGQIISYGIFNPRQKHIYLFGETSVKEIKIITEVCEKTNIKLTFY